MQDQDYWWKVYGNQEERRGESRRSTPETCLLGKVQIYLRKRYTPSKHFPWKKILLKKEEGKKKREKEETET